MLGTLLLVILSGHYRYAHLAALRGDDIAPSLLGLTSIVSEDCVRRALARIGAEQGQDWLRRLPDQTCHAFWDNPWIIDIDVTIKPIYGRQEGASIGYSPQKPGRPSKESPASQAPVKIEVTVTNREVTIRIPITASAAERTANTAALTIATALAPACRAAVKVEPTGLILTLSR